MIFPARIFLAVVLSFCGNVLCLTEYSAAVELSPVNQKTSDQLPGGQDTPSPRTPASNFVINSLTEEERAWLREHPVIRVAQAPDWSPVEFIDERGELSGMSEDYLNLIEQRLGVTFARVRILSWQEAYARLKRWEIDMTTSVTVTPERTEFLAFTKPYMKIPNIIFADINVTYIADMRELAGMKVAVADGYAVREWIPRDFPDIQLVKVKNVQEGLEKLQRREVSAYIGDMLVSGYYLTKLKMTTLKIAGNTPYVNAQSMAVRKDWAILAGILDQALDSISESERNEIYREWLPIRYEHGFNYTLLWQALALFAVILLVLVIWIRKLSGEIRRRKKAEVVASKSEQRFHAIASNTPDHIVIQDCQLRYTFVVNPQLGLTEQDMLGKTDYDFLSREEADKLTRAKRRVLETGEPLHFETSLISKEGEPEYFDGSYVPKFDGQGKVDGLIGYFRNVTERKKAEEALRESEEKFSAAFQGSPVALAILTLDGKYVDTNRSFCKLVGYSRDEVIGKNMIDLGIISAEVREKVAAAIASAGGSVNNAEIKFHLRDGSFRYILYSTDTISFHGILHRLSTGIDITKRKQVEEELKKYHDHLEDLVKERTEELEDVNEKSRELAQANVRITELDCLKSAFLATISHELRTPLNSIIGFTGIVLQEMSGPLNEEQAKQLAMVKSSANHLLDLINDVLDISKIEAGQVQITRKSFDVRSVIEAALRTVMPLAAKKGLSLDSVIDSNVGVMISDRRRVEQILINLINNAIKFTEQGKVRIECRIKEERLEICVRDTGIGIKMEDVGKLFIPFSQIDTGLARNHEGTGLGLSICKKLLEMLGGMIWVESEWGKGSAFTFTLPLS